ncbi:MAG: hypothetical protein AABZ60_13220 [Planctomycetota bacterium]
MKKNFDYLFICFWCNFIALIVFLCLSGCTPPQSVALENIEPLPQSSSLTKASTPMPIQTQPHLPILDQNLPTKIETAIFALG